VIGFADEHGDSADEAMDAGFKMQGLEAATGKNYDQLLKEYGSVRDSVEKETSRLKEVQRKESDVQESLGEMEPLKEVKSKLDAHGIPVVRLDGFIALYDKLEKLGFTEQAADILATEMSKLGTTPRKAAKQLSEALAEYATLQEALEGQREEHSELRKQLELLNEEVMEKGGELRKAKEELRTIQGGIEDQRTAYEKDKEEMGKNSAGLKSQIGELTDQIRRLEATKKGLEGALESSDELLEAIEAKAAKNEKLQLILSLFGEGIPPLPRRQMLETMAALGGSFVAYLGFFEQKTPVVDNLIGKVVQMDDAIELVLRNTR
jgi:DNA repair exonuclease SbcCD ATPase subunit